MVVFQRVGDICKGDLTIRIVDGACRIVFRVARHRDVGGVSQFLVLLVHLCGFELEVERIGRQLHWLIVAIPVDLRCLNSEFLFLIFKGVGKRGNFLIGAYIGAYIIAGHLHHGGGFHFQLAAAIVNDGNSHTVIGAVIRNTCNLIPVVGGDNLGDVVLINAGFSEGDTSEVKGNRRSFAGACICLQLVRCIEFAT